MKAHRQGRNGSRLYPILLLIFSLLVVFPPLVSQAQAPYVYYSLYNDPWSLMRRDADGSNPVTIYTSPLDYVRAIAIDHAANMYFYDSQSGSETVFKSDLDGSNRSTFLSAKISALAAGKGYVYYAYDDSPYTLNRRDADGSNLVTIYTPPIGDVTRIAIDFVNDKLFFYENGSGAEIIYTSELDGSNRTVFLSNKITSLAVGAGYVYYALYDDPWSLMRRDLDGSNPVTIYTPPVDYVRAIAVDTTNSQVYFYDSEVGSETIFKANLDGSNRSAFESSKILALATHGESPTSVTLQRLTANEGKEQTNRIYLLGLLVAGLAGLVIMLRKTAQSSPYDGRPGSP